MSNEHQKGHQPSHQEVEHATPPQSAGAFHSHDSELHQHEIEVPEQREAKVGDIVLYVLDGGHAIGAIRPALVVRAWNALHLNLNVLTDFTNDFVKGTPGSDGNYWATSISYSKDTTKPRTWHWPEDSKL